MLSEALTMQPKSCLYHEVVLFCSELSIFFLKRLPDTTFALWTVDFIIIINYFADILASCPI